MCVYTRMCVRAHAFLKRQFGGRHFGSPARGSRFWAAYLKFHAGSEHFSHYAYSDMRIYGLCVHDAILPTHGFLFPASHSDHVENFKSPHYGAG